MHWHFIVATTLISLMPGPSMIIIMMTTLDHGLFKGTQTILGVIVADAILLALVLSGVGVLLYACAIVFSALKWLGVVYLIYLGIAQLQSKVKEDFHAGSAPRVTPFLQGIVTTLLNPKIIGFLIVYFPQFINREETVTHQMVLLGPLFLLIVFTVFMLCALGAKALRSVLETHRGWVMMKNVSGVSLIGCGVLSAAG
jgi:threonine/homoserine/homoserine lactone efflux protein